MFAMKKMLVMGILICSHLNAYGLEVDEKLTIRFLKLSNSKKTVLINRGAEDGLVVGDHAKFFITNGVVARGMVEKVSPTRSIWSIYRVVVPDEMVDNKVLNLKIATPVKVTEDPTKSLKEEAIPEEKMAEHESAPSMESKVSQAESKASGSAPSEEDKQELEELGLKGDTDEKVKSESVKTKVSTEVVPANVIATSSMMSSLKSWDIFGSLSMNTLSGTIEGDSTTTTSTSASLSVFDLSMGIERYFFTSDTFKDLSLFGLVYKRNVDAGDRIKSTTDWFQYGGGFNYHFYNSARSINRVIGFGTFSAGMGSSTLKSKDTVTATPIEESIEGSNSFLSVGVGMKYLLGSFGVRGVVDYNSVKETYNYAEGLTVNRSFQGPRVQIGMSYRF